MSDAPTYDPDQPDQPDQGEPDTGRTSGDPERAQTLEQQKEQARRALEGQGDTEDDDSPA